MAILKCRMCGGDVATVPGMSCGTCEHCGSAMTLPRLPDERRANLFNRADHFRRQSEFDKAAAAYESILNEDNADAEAHWGVVLSRYGIEYVEDPRTQKRLPTCHRVQADSILRDPDYRLVLEHAQDSASKVLYQAQAAAIAEIQKGILALSAQEEPFDVFICYKETTDGGSRTRDSVLAQDIYHQLLHEKYRVFFSRITLENRLGQAYEPCIFAALNSAKVMVVVGTKAEHFTAVWVRNEWSRFLSLRKKDSRKLIIPCYLDMSPYALPEELSALQSQDMSKLGFLQDLVRGIKKALDADKQPLGHGTGSPVAPTEVGALVKRTMFFLEDGDFKSAEQYAERVLDKDPECAEAYLAKLMIQLAVRSEDQLGNGTEPLTTHGHYQKALRFSAASLKQRLEGYNRKRLDAAEKVRQEKLERERREQLERERQAAEEKAERERQENLLARAEELLDRGDIDSATLVLTSMKRVSPDVNYEKIDARLQVLRGELAELMVPVESTQRTLERLGTEAGRFSPFPRLALMARCRKLKSEALVCIKSLRTHAARYPNSEWAALLGSTAESLQQALGGFEAGAVSRLSRQLPIWLSVWLALILTLGFVGKLCVVQIELAFQQRKREAQQREQEARRIEAEEKVKAEAEERERAKLAVKAKAEAEAEERERARLFAKAKARAEVEEEALFRKFGLSVPANAGASVMIGGGSTVKVSSRWIPSGRFKMGSPGSESNRQWDENLHEVVLSRGFLMAETECTQEQWEAVMGSNPSSVKGGDRPVERVNWKESKTFCQKLTEMHRKEGLLPDGYKWDLPTEAQWEYACRAGTTGPYAGDLGEMAWYYENPECKPHAVKTKRPNDWGLYDMHGNVREWCSDKYGDYPTTGAQIDPTGPSSASRCVVRGGSTYDGVVGCRSASRHRGEPGESFFVVGFRPVLSSVR